MPTDPYKIIKHPLVTEKGTLIAEQNKYLFCVADAARRTEVRAAVEAIYKVHVTTVHIMNTPSKKRRYRMGSEGYRAGYKKAIVTLKEGDKIALT